MNAEPCGAMLTHVHLTLSACVLPAPPSHLHPPGCDTQECLGFLARNVAHPTGVKGLMMSF